MTSLIAVIFARPIVLSDEYYVVVTEIRTKSNVVKSYLIYEALRRILTTGSVIIPKQGRRTIHLNTFIDTKILNSIIYTGVILVVLYTVRTIADKIWAMICSTSLPRLRKRAC